MKDEKKVVYSEAAVEFVTVATQTCLFLEQTSEHDKEYFIDKALKLLPLLYLKAHLLLEMEEKEDLLPQEFVSIEDYNFVRVGVHELLGGDDAYLEVLTEELRYNDEPTTAYISENIADIYQEIRNLAANYQTRLEDAMEASLFSCRAAFKEHWGQKLLNALRALHVLYVEQGSDDDMSSHCGLDGYGE